MSESSTESLSEAAAVKPENLGLKNFHAHPDFENFYRFVHESNLREEALKGLDNALSFLNVKKKKKKKTRAKRAKKQ
ncbi:MAG: hypothetical protein HOE90_19875 [Bacteriovoracaceae bacterium]|jgi:hypothetical protein|nr:hypothetical protein [Bacteriovoracaceae bacterium]